MLRAAVSKDQTLVAVIVPSRDRGVIQIYQRESGLLQSTLTTRKSNSLQANNNKNNNTAETTLQTVEFCGNHHVVAQTPSCLLVWDLTRGGVVSQTIAEDRTILAWTCSGTPNDTIAVLVGSDKSSSRRSSSSGGGGSDEDDDDDKLSLLKLQVIQYNPTSGKVERKIKCKKGNAGDEFGIAFVTTKGKEQLLVRCNGIGVFDCEAGKRIQKIKHRDHKKKSKKDGFGGTGLVVCNHLVAVPRVSSVALYNLKTNQWLEPVSASSNLPIVHMWQDGDSNNIRLLVDNALYLVSGADPVSPITKVQCNHTFGLLPASQQALTAILHNVKAKTSLQVQTFDTTKLLDSKADFVLQWQKPIDDDKEESSKASKRTANSLIVLGPGQAGEEHTKVTEHKRKKPKLSSSPQERTQESGEDAAGMSIADRLKRLSEAMIEKDNDDIMGEEEETATKEDSKEDNKGKPKKRAKWVAKNATTESLSKLLGQALEGGDNTMLEMALGVSNRNVITETLAGLGHKEMDLLMTKLILRLANVPAKADNLALWTSLVLQSGKLKERKQITPLRNLISDRCDHYPYLMMLEAKLIAIEREGKERKAKIAAEKARVKEMLMKNRAADRARRAKEAEEKAAAEAAARAKKAIKT